MDLILGYILDLLERPKETIQGSLFLFVLLAIFYYSSIIVQGIIGLGSYL